MDIKKEMIDAMKARKKDEFNLWQDYKYNGLDIGRIRSMIGYRGLDLVEGVSEEKLNILGVNAYKYFVNETSHYVVFNIHGGGFYGGSVEVMQYCNRYLAKKGDFHVYAIDYTLAPKSKFPDTMFEIYRVIQEISKMYPNSKFILTGDSAGAHLAMNVALLDNSMFSYIFLYYPVISLLPQKNFKIDELNLDEDAMYAKAHIQMLYQSTKLMQKLYLKEDYDINSKFFNLLNIPFYEFEKLPKIFIAKAQFDYFNLDIDEFSKKFKVEVIEYSGVSHGFLEFLGYVEEAKNLLDLTIEKIKGV